MNIEIITQSNRRTAHIHSDVPIITDGSSAMDLIAKALYEWDVSQVIINKEALSEAFFDLSTRIAGEVLQKFVNYQVRMAVTGDFSNYTSKSLKDFIYECNKGRHIFFLGSNQEAYEKLSDFK